MTGTDPLSQAGAAYQEARAAIAQYRLDDARRHLDDAKRLLTDSGTGPDFELSLRIQLTESWLTCDELGLGAALEQLAAARGLAEAAHREDLQALAHIQSGVLRARAGFVDDALAELRPAVALSGALPVDDRVRLLLNKGAIGSQAGRLAEAAEDLATAARLAVDLPDYAFMAMHNLGFVEYLRGDLPAAITTMLAADELAAPVDRSVSRLDRARVLMEVGLVDDAAELLAETITALRSSSMAEELTGALLDQARCALLRGRTAEAVAIAEEGARRSTERGEDPRGLAASGVRLEALVVAGDGDPAALVEDARRLSERASGIGLRWLADRATALRVIAASRLGPQVPDDAAAAALRRMRRSPYLETRLLAIHAQLRLTGEARSRRRLFGSAISDLARARAGMASLDLRTALTMHSSPIIALDLEQAVAGGRAWRVLAATERWRSALETVPSVTPSHDPGVATLWSSLRQRHEDLRDPAVAADGSVTAEVAKLERQLRERSWRTRGAAGGASPALWRRGGRETSALLSYFWSSGHLHLVHVEPGRPARLLRLGGRDEVGELVARAGADAAALARAPHGPLAAAILSSLDDVLSQLDAALLPEGLGDAPVVVVPSGALARLPWGMLPRLRSRSLSVSRSAASWRDRATVVDGDPAVAVASGPDLALAEREAEGVCARWARATRLPGGPAAVREALASQDVVHIAAHGRHRADNPLFSSLLLHGGSLFAHELESVAVKSSLVVLSACGAGRARLRPGDEALGLTASLLALGVGAVVAPLTDVPDAVACETMGALHEGLAAGLDGPTALARASDGLLARSFTWFGSDWRVSAKG